MAVLPAQFIRRLCLATEKQRADAREHVRLFTFADSVPPIVHALCAEHPLISSFCERTKLRGKSYGLGPCTYDCRIDQDLVLSPMPWLISEPRENWRHAAALASTIEQFNIPDNICGSVIDKSTYARVFVSAFNTHLDPGWGQVQDPETGEWSANHLTVELVNLGREEIVFRRGDPVCQVKFEFLYEPTELSYRGEEYCGQPAHPVEAIYERSPL